MPAHGDQPSGVRLLRTDIRGAFLLLNEARHRTMERVFGVSRAQSNLVTAIALAVTAETARDRAARFMRGPGGPTRADAILGGGLLKELVHGIAGLSSRDTPLFGTLVAIGVLAALRRVILGRPVRAFRAGSHRARLMFNRRYGHLVRPSRQG
jgi:hypothetical protein